MCVKLERLNIANTGRIVKCIENRKAIGTIAASVQTRGSSEGMCARQAIEAYNRALALKPDDPGVLNDQGAMFRQTGDVAQALRN